MGVKILFLPDCALILFLLKHRSIWVFLDQKIGSQIEKVPLNYNIDNLHLNFKNVNKKLLNCIKVKRENKRTIM